MSVKFQSHNNDYDKEKLFNQYNVLNISDNSNEKKPVFLMVYNNNTVSVLDKDIVDTLLNIIKFNNEKESEKITSPTLSIKKSFIPCFKNRKKYQLNTKEIHYAYSNMSGIHLVTQDGEYHTNLTLKKVAELSHLMYCNRSYLANYAHIKKIERLANGCGKAYTHNENTIPISRNQMKKM